jgi:hypothetical protein
MAGAGFEIPHDPGAVASHRLSWHSIMGCCGLNDGRGCPSTREPVAIAGTEGKPEAIQAESTEATASAAPN